MAPRPSTRHYPSRHWEDRGAERPPDPVEASRTPLVDQGNPLNHQADVADPDSDSDPYADAEDEELTDDER